MPVSSSSPDVVVIQKQTALERYTRRPLNIDFFEYLEKAGQDVDGLVEAHDSHLQTRELLLQLLLKLGLSYEIMNLDELEARGVSFYSETDRGSGFHPKHHLVIALGGDGTLLHASHYVGGETTLLGVNSCPGSSVGHLCAANTFTMEECLGTYLAGASQIQKVRRLKVGLPNLQRLPLGLNDVLFCNRHPGATSRYQISVKKLKSQDPIATERHLSSGMWIAGPAGSTAAISSYGLSRLDISSEKFLMAVREPYLPDGKKLELLKSELDGNDHFIELFCRIRQGLVCVDGADSCVYLGFGDTIEISLPPECVLNLVV